MRALRELAAAGGVRGPQQRGILLWGAVVYRLINRLSTFSRWAAVCYLREKHGEKWAWKSEYEEKLYGEDRDEAARKIAVSGSSLLGRLTECRDKWALPEVKDVLDGTTAACTVRLPRPSEIRDFVAFVTIETDAKRGIMTAEHQSGAGREAVCKMLKSLAKKKCLSALSATVAFAPDAKTALDALCRFRRSARSSRGRSSATSSAWRPWNPTPRRARHQGLADELRPLRARGRARALHDGRRRGGLRRDK